MSVQILVGDCRETLRTLPDASVHCVVTSPPYFGLRDYRVEGQIGLEPTPAEFVAAIVSVMAEVRRVLRDDGTLWLNIGDSYNSNSDMTRNDAKAAAGLRELPRQIRAPLKSLKVKELIGIPWLLAFALRADGWFLRQDVIWNKPNPMPESVTDRCTKAHEYLFLFTKAPAYFFDADAVAEDAVSTAMRGPAQHGDLQSTNGNGGLSRRPVTGKRNKRSVWTVPSEGFDFERCTACGTNYAAEGYRDLPRRLNEAGDKVVVCRCGKHDAWLSHFATYPPELIEPCILAGTSAHGCCADCGAPWQRVVEKKPMVIARSARTHDLGHTRSSGRMVEPPARTTTGWKATCGCGARPSRRAIVLDPFGGAGTTGLVADRLQRDAILCELNPDYAALARFRIDNSRGGGLLDAMEAAE